VASALEGCTVQLSRLSLNLPLAALAVVALLLRLVRLTNYQGGLSPDEAFSFALTQRGFNGMLGLFRDEANGTLYELVLYPVAQINHGVAALRMPAVVAGTVAVIALYWAGREFVGRGAAWLAGALLSVHPLAITFSQWARPYSFVMLFAALSFGCLARALSGTRRGWWVAYVLAMGALGYSQSVAVPLLLVPQAVAVLLRGRKAALRGGLSLVALGGVLIPLATLLTAERLVRNPLYWLDRPTLANLTSTAVLLVGDRKGMAASVVVIGAAIVTKRRDIPGGIRMALTHPLTVVAAWALLPTLILFLLSQVSPSFWYGYAISALPGICLLIGAVIARLPLAAGVVSLALFAAIFVRDLVASPDYDSGWSAAMTTLSDERDADDSVLFDIPDGLTIAGYYDAAFTADNGRLIATVWGDTSLPKNVSVLDDPGGYGRAPEGPPSRELISELSQRTGRIFVVVSEANRQGDIERTAGLEWAAQMCTTQSDHFRFLTVIAVSSCPEN